MKTIFKLFTISILTISIFSCNSSNDDDSNGTPNSGTPNSTLIGTWDLDEVNGAFDFQFNGAPFTTTMVGSNYNNSIITFSDNPDKVEMNHNFDLTSTTEVWGNTFTEEENVDMFYSDLDWSLSNDIITISNDSLNLNFEIIELTNSNLTLKIERTEETDVMGQTLTNTGYIEYHYSK